MAFSIKESGFGGGDYAVFFILCITSCAGGLWYSALGSRSKALVDIKDYLLGGKTMSTFPVAMSLIASYVSGVTILGTPVEVYNYGTQYWLIIIGVTLSCVIVSTIYLPVFHKLRLSSSYEYLELRFNRHVRAVASILFLLDEVLFLPMVVYVPALAFNQLTGFNVFAVGGVMVLICGLYTVLGGLKAVVWTDAVQTGIMFIGVILVAVAGTLAGGGVAEVIKIARDNGRADLSNWSFSPYERQTGWGAIVGGCLYWTCFNSVNQTMVQRYIALPTKRKAINAIVIFCVGAILAISLCVWSGLTAWAAWIIGGCSEGGAPLVDDRLLPAFVTYVAKVQHLPGLAGVFLAGVFGAGLSRVLHWQTYCESKSIMGATAISVCYISDETVAYNKAVWSLSGWCFWIWLLLCGETYTAIKSSLSAVLNACALVCIEDLMHGWLRVHPKPLTEGLIARGVTGCIAIVSIAMLLVIEKLGGVLGVATALSAIAASATCGIFTLGMVCWWVGPRGAIAGGIAGALMAGTLSIGSQSAAARGLRAPPVKVTAACAVNATYVASNYLDPETVFPLFRISFHWIAPLGLLVTLLVGMLIGWLFDKPASINLDADLFTPAIWKCLPAAAHENAGNSRKIVAIRAKGLTSNSPLILDNVTNKVETKGETSRNIRNGETSRSVRK